MNRLLTYGSVEAIPFYNCSWKSLEEWEASGVQRPLLGIPITITGIVIELLYIPVIFIIFKTKLIKLTCYKIMTFLALNDMAATVVSSIITGPLLTRGAVFCSNPTLIYIVGSFGLSTWCCSCAVTVSLFFNRIICIGFKEYADCLEKKMAYTYMIICVFYMFYITFFTPAACFNSFIMAWISDPLSEKEPSQEAAAWYENDAQSLNNGIYVIVMFALFTIYYILVKKLAHGQKSKAARSIFIQCSIICFLNTVTAVVYNALKFIPLAPWILVFCQWCWTFNHGAPAIIYLTMNDTIRREFKKLMFGKTSNKVDDRSSIATGKSTSKI